MTDKGKRKKRKTNRPPRQKDQNPAKPAAPVDPVPFDLISFKSPVLPAPTSELLATFAERHRGQFQSLFGELTDPFPSPGQLTTFYNYVLPQRDDTRLAEEISTLRKQVAGAMEAMAQKDVSLQTAEVTNTQLTEKLEALLQKERLQHLLSRVGERGQHRLRTDPEFRQQFDREGATDAYVLSIDLRRSTELMLKSREPRMYAEFMLGLARQLRDIVLANFGVFDKFTGDGVLAFFPEFFSGPQAGLWATRTALSAHALFQSHYRHHRRSFVAVLSDAGLGIGLDFGPLHIVQIGTEVTVVGTPVVYACRMAGAKAGTTLVNQPAYERLLERHGEYCDLRESQLDDVTHEGRVLAYELTGSGKEIAPTPPPWAISPEEQDGTGA